MKNSNAVADLMHGHRSIRKYKPDPIPEAMLEQILACALRASSSGNMQTYSVIVTTDPDLKRELLSPHFDQPMVTEAPALLTFCADFHRMRRWLALREAPDNFDNFMSFMIATLDATLASQNAALAAESLGLGICYMGTTLASCAEIGHILRCPSHVVPVAGFSLGFPAETPALRDRLPLKGVVHRDRYEMPSDDDVLSVYRDRERAGWDRYMADPELRARVEQHGVENLAQVYTKVKYTRESHVEYSRTVLNYLVEQGFLTGNELAPETTAE